MSRAPSRLRLASGRGRFRLVYYVTMFHLTLTTDGSSVRFPEPARAGFHVWHESGGSVCAYSHAEEGRCWIHVPGVASYCCEGDALTAFASSCVAREQVIDRYQRTALPLALHHRGLELLHAGAVLTPCGVVAFCGPSEIGKSTLAHGLSRRGYAQWSDDALALEITAGQVQAVPLEFRVRLRSAPAAYFAAEPGAPRLPPACRSRRTDAAPLAGLVVLRRQMDAIASVCAARLAPAQAFAAIVACGGCYLEDPDRKRRMVTAFLQLIEQVPVWELHFPSGLDSLPDTLDAVERLMGDGLTQARLPGSRAASKTEGCL